MRKWRIVSCAFALVLFAGYFLKMERTRYQSKVGGNNHAPAKGQVLSYDNLPLIFAANQGQTDDRVNYISQGRSYVLFLTPDKMVLKLSGRGEGERRKAQIAHSRLAVLNYQMSKSVELGFTAPKFALATTGSSSQMPASVVRVRLVGANPHARVVGERELPGKINYFIGNDPKRWRMNVPTYARVLYQSVYPHVDLVYYGTQDGRLECDFVVRPGGDPRAITLEVGSRQSVGGSRHGGENMAAQPALRVATNGDLLVPTQDGEVRFRKPFIYQQGQLGASNQKSEAAHRKFLDGRYVIKANAQVEFHVSSYDRSQPLVIDPVLVYSTYLGGSETDDGTAVAVDSTGSVYVTGWTTSPDFPSVNPLQRHCNNCSDANDTPDSDVFVAKLNPTESALIYSTYLGGSANDMGSGIAVDAAGDAYVTGSTSSGDFPVTAGAFQTTQPGAGCVSSVPSYYICTHAFISKLNATGSALIYSTYLGGSVSDSAVGIAVDSSGSAYVTGGTTSPDFPVTSAAIQPTSTAYCGSPTIPYTCVQGFVSKLNATGSALDYSITVGGTLPEAIAVDPFESVYVTGDTSLTDFPVTPGAFQTTSTQPCGYDLNGKPIPCVHPFVFKLNAAGTAFVYSTYLAGSGADSANALAVDSSGDAYVTGRTSGGFPLKNPIQVNDESAIGTAFVSKLNPSGTALIYSTYLGGGGQTFAKGITVDASGDAFVTGNTGSPGFPLVGAIQASCGVNELVAFVAGINAAGSAMLYSTYLGCSDDEQVTANSDYVTVGNAIAADSAGNVYVTGNTGVTSFPVSNPLQPTLLGVRNVFVAKISPDTQNPWVSLSSINLPFGSQAVNSTSPPLTETVTNGGGAKLEISAVTIAGANAGDFKESGDTCTGATVPPNGSCAVSVLFAPPAAGNRSAELDITDNASNSPQVVALSGAAGASGPVAEVTPTSLDFGKQSVGPMTASLPVTLSNTGNVPLEISTMATTFHFEQTNDCGGIVAAGSSCTINVTISPPAAGPLSGTLTIIDNSNGVAGRSQIVALSGAGQDFTLTPAPGSSTSANVTPGQSATYTLSLEGVNGYDNTATLECIGAPANSSCTVSPSAVTVAGAPTEITVTVTTTVARASAPLVRLLPPGPPLSPFARTLIVLALILEVLAWAAGRRNHRKLWPSRSGLLALLGGLMIAFALTACGGGDISQVPVSPPASGTPSGTYTLNILATAAAGTGALSHYVNLTLNVSYRKAKPVVYIQPFDLLKSGSAAAGLAG